MNKYEQHLKDRETEVKKLFKPSLVKETITMKNPNNYRHKVVGTFGYLNKKIICGQYIPKTHKVDLLGRELQHPLANKILDSCAKIATQMDLKPFNERSGSGLLRHVMVRIGYNTNEVMVIIVIGDRDLPGKKEFTKRLLKLHPEITTVVLNINMLVTTMVLGNKNVTSYGPGFIFDSIDNIRFKLFPSTFYQVNPIQMTNLYNKAIEMGNFKETDNVIDVFCGIGTLTLLIAKHVRNVIGIELNQDSILAAKGNAKFNKVDNATFVCEDATSWMSKQSGRVDAVVLDPPRSGCTPVFLHSLVKLKPNKIVYISCNPITQKEDISVLERNGYKLNMIQPVDMFPFTEHVEAIILMTRSGSGDKK